MRAVADTHAAVWFLWKPESLSRAALEAIDEAIRNGERIGVSSISLAEVLYLAEKDKIREDAFDLFLEALTAEAAPFSLLPVTLDVVSAMRALPRAAIPDMPDRIIAATALSYGVPLITRDDRIRQSDIEAIW